jgi:hypothetical protein
LFFKSRAEDNHNCPAGQRFNPIPEAKGILTETALKKKVKIYG